MTAKEDEALQVSPPLLRSKVYQAPSIFTPDALLREARRQKGIDAVKVPKICVLDPDGDIVRYLLSKGSAIRDAGWACYHTDLYSFIHESSVKN
jgi:uridine phosphorylase